MISRPQQQQHPSAQVHSLTSCNILACSGRFAVGLSADLPPAFQKSLCCKTAPSFQEQDTQSLKHSGSSTCLDTSRAAYLLTPLNLYMRQIDVYVGGWPLADGKDGICKLMDPRCNVQGQVPVAVAEVAQQLMRGLQAATTKAPVKTAACSSGGGLHPLGC